MFGNHYNIRQNERKNVKMSTINKLNSTGNDRAKHEGHEGSRC
jgi:hypothetical protein